MKLFVMHTVCRQGAHSGGSCIKDGGTQSPNKSVILEEVISDSNSKNSPTSEKTKNKEMDWKGLGNNDEGRNNMKMM